MTKRHKSFIILLTLLSAYFFWRGNHLPVTKSSSPSTPGSGRTVASAVTKTQETPKDQAESTVKTTKDFHQHEPLWETQFKQTLIAQGGSTPPEITLKKLGTLTHNQFGTVLKADAYLVTLKVDQKTVSTFKAIVDRNTGKILQSWDQPIFEDFHRKDQFAVKIDPRYHQ